MTNAANKLTGNIEGMHGAQKYGEAWRVVNEITGRKKAKEGQVSGSSPEERVQTWFSHFKNLLGSPASTVDTEEELPNIFEDLEIEDGPFTIEEYRKVKSSLKAGKAGGPDGISPDVLKSCDFGDVCLKFCNKALLEKEHTVALSVLLQSCTIVSYRTESVKYTT